MTRELKYFQAIREALDLSLEQDPSVYLMGLGVPDPKGIFGTTLGLQEKYGPERVMDMPTAENGMTGVALGSAIAGMRPVMVHQRLDFALLAVEQIVNQAAKWHYMFAGKSSVPMVIRLVIGRGWGQGPQHSQSLQSWFAHVPGLKVVMPATPYDAKGLMLSSIRDDNPVIFLEHRWLHNMFGAVPEGDYEVPIGRAHVIREGRDVTIAAVSHMVVEALQASKMLAEVGIEAEVVDVRTLRPLDTETIAASVRKTRRILVADTDWKTGGFSAEIVSWVCENQFDILKTAPRRVALSDCPVPTSQVLANPCYPRPVDIARQVCEMVGQSTADIQVPVESSGIPLDIPDASFAGPF
ncbi:MAG: alpha-ketoacid dehydrogenase subunit beta [Candidatus Omnitrophota bacterium]|nr:alpha-ketoacid dehydrogenase subunit beta [Candidatus Omnitrophota bacterium]